MGRVYISFLGTNDYLPCTYYVDHREVAGVRFVQEATTQLFCQGWTSADRILIFTTTEAYERNWVNDGHTDRDGGQLTRVGLEERLSCQGLGAPVTRIEIPAGRTEAEIWGIFDLLYNSLMENDQAVFDVTHAFRSIPMLAIVVLHYAKVLKQLDLSGIYYGAFEVLGSIPEARAIPEAQRRVPIFDLTPFDVLLDWTVAIDRFLGTGDALPACRLARTAINPLLKATRGKDQAAAAIRQVTKHFEAFSKAMATCRGPRISPIATRLKEEIDRCADQDLLLPFKPLLEKARRKVAPFDGDPERDGIRAARWCLEHNLIQQGYTILQEFLVSQIAQGAGGDPQRHEHREIVNSAATIVLKNLPESDWSSAAGRHPELTRQYLAFLTARPEFAKTMQDLSAVRNDLNHAGFRTNAIDANVFGPKLSELVTRLEDILG